MTLNKSMLIKAVLVLITCFGLYCLYVWSAINQEHTIAATELTIPAGASSFKISRTLEKEGIINSARYFRWLARITHADAKLKPGTYRFEGHKNMFDIIDVLEKGQVLQFKVTIPEGLRTDEMLKLLSERTQTPLQDWQRAQQGITQAAEFEGLFLPETYLYSKPINPKRLLQQMWDARAKVEAAIAQEKQWSPAQMTRNRIMASIVEKETALAHERVWVSAAIHNRIRKNMRLQMDPTVIYGLYRTQGFFSGNLRRQDLKSDTPWNTYTRRDLPPTPICNPGAESLRAAAFPADVDYLYFVADGTGGHAFAATLEEHNANVRKWINIERRR